MITNSSQDIFFMQRTLQLASKAESVGEVPVGTVAVIDGVIIGEGLKDFSDERSADRIRAEYLLGIVLKKMYVRY